MVGELFSENLVQCIQGDGEVAKELLELPFDHIFFTGSPAVGKLVMRAASVHLSSITLELGGKCPVFITSRASFKDAAIRIAATKFVVAGQTCVAPDFILIEKGATQKFLPHLIASVKKLYMNETGSEINVSIYTKIISDLHFERLLNISEEALSQGWERVLFGKHDRSNQYFFPTIILGNNLDSRVMKEELFGPILPIVEIDSISEGIAIVNEMPKPLALYIYSKSQQEQNQIIQETSAGAVCINESSLHYLHPHFPFGGVGNSGMGKSHGYNGFLEFSNEKPVLKQKQGFTLVQLFYPPYTAFTRKVMNLVFRLFYR
jgi:aldehyde dehydrogenase (NAD+)